MHDDYEPLYEVVEVPDSYEPDATGGSCWRNCFFISITLLVIFSLLFTSIFTVWQLRQRDARTADPIRMAALPERDEAATPEPVDDGDPLPSIAVPLEPLSEVEEAAVIDDNALNRIVLVTNDGQLETVAPDGTERHRLTDANDGYRFQFPAWSPDDSAVAAIGGTSGGAGVFVMADSSATNRPLSDSQVYFSRSQTPIYLYWSPDSQDIAFLADHARGALGLNVVPGDGRQESRLLATGSPLYWDWSGDSQVILFHAAGGRSGATLAALDLEAREQTENLAEPGFFQAPGISPNGRYWAYAEDVGRGVSALVVANTDTGKRASVEQAASIGMIWSPVEQQLAYVSGGPDAHPYWGPLRVYDAESAETKLLTNEPVLAFFWSPDGGSIAMITLSDRNDGGDSIAEGRTRRVSRRAVPAQQRGSAMLTLSVIDVESGTGLRLLDFQPTPAYVTQFLPFFAQYALSHQIWAPDSSAVVIPVREEGQDVVVVVPTNGGPAMTVGEGDTAFWSSH